MEKLRKAALWMVVVVIGAAAVYIWHPWPDRAAGDQNFSTPKGDITLRFDKEDALTSLIPGDEARKNKVNLVVTFVSGTKKYCGVSNCSTDAPVKKVEARVGEKVIATWP